MTTPIADYRWCDREGRPIADGIVLRLGEPLKHVDAPDRQVYRVELPDRSAALKVRRWRGLRRRWLASRGSPVDHEWAMLIAARSAGLPVPEPIALGVARSLGLVREQAMLLELLPDRTRLRDVAQRAAADRDAATLDAVQRMLVDAFASIRRAGFADDDFGVHNLLVPIADPLGSPPVWIDLETAFPADPHEPGPTVRTLRIALAGWWTSTNGDQQRLQQTFQLAAAAAPQPTGGWPAHLPGLNRALHRRLRKALRLSRIDRLPAPLTL